MCKGSARQNLIDWLNDMLEIDHDLVCDVMMREHDINTESQLADSPLAHDKKGVKVMTALSLISAVLDKPVEAVFEGDIIQRFE